MTRIGYLIPEFPGQTHIFFWRERQVLTDLGIETALISTRRPPQGIVSHSWAVAAQQETIYLVELDWKATCLALLTVLQSGPIAWMRCARAIATAKLSGRERLRLAAIVLVAGNLVRHMRQNGLRHVHVHSCADAAHLAMLASLLSGITYSLTLHGPGIAVYGPNQAQKWRYASFALVISQQLLTLAQKTLGDDLPDVVVVAPMGVNLDSIQRTKPYVSPSPQGPFRVVSCGRLNPVKGHGDLIQAIAALRQQGLDVSLRIAGEDEMGGAGYHRVLAQLIEDQGLNDSVTLLGAVSEAQIREELESAHVFALASLNEGVPVAVMEAMAMELPVVVTDVGGVAELVDPNRDGILVQPEDIPMMTKELANVLQNPELAEALGRAARPKVVTQFSHRRSAEAIAQCLAQH